MNQRIRATMLTMCLIQATLGLAGCGGAGETVVDSTNAGTGSKATKQARTDAQRAELISRETSPGGKDKLAPSEATLRLVETLYGTVDLPVGQLDGQRLWNGSNYAAYATVFPSAGLGGWKKDSDFVPTARVVAIVDANEDFSPGRPRSLALKKGTNCVYLQRVSGSWVSHIQPGTATSCPPPKSPVPAAEIIDADEGHTTGTLDSDYPTAVRFSEDKDGFPVVGLRCGKKWCEIGTTRSKIIKPKKEFSAGRASKIKGWHDEQRLSIKDGAGTLLRSRIVGSIIPMEHLGDLNDPSQFADWVPVAIVYITGNKSEYDKSAYPQPDVGKKGWGFRFEKEDTLMLKYEGRWKAQVKHSDTDAFELGNVVSNPHYDQQGKLIVPPATARWIWSISDEGIWVRCAEGCCTIEEGIGHETATMAGTPRPAKKK